jgi:methionine-rich copper-binding protein CopC
MKSKIQIKKYLDQVLESLLTGTGSNLATDLISSTSTARTSFSIWQNSGDAVPPGGYLSFATSGTFTVYLRIIYSDASERIVPLIITVAADTTAPTTTFSPADSATNVAVSANITITFNEAVKLATNGTILENSNLASIITLKQTSSSGTDIPFTATINAAKKVITIDPTSNLTANTVYYVAISAGVEDTFGNEISLTSVSFTTAP